MNAARREPETLARGECMRLLGQADIGRLALSSGALPIIVAVNYRVDDDVVLVKTGAGEHLRAATDGTVVAFEADGIEPGTQAAWSVSIAGIAREATGRDDAAVPDWIAPDADRVVAISIERVTGYRVRLDPNARIAGSD
jgi:nitroimidazol reductase NimA-like FMN-containing flavoprotein (pyridoxamine 5'-phosphate oxidase superfamily)